jgi:hypothetical protein
MAFPLYASLACTMIVPKHVIAAKPCYPDHFHVMPFQVVTIDFAASQLAGPPPSPCLVGLPAPPLPPSKWLPQSFSFMAALLPLSPVPSFQVHPHLYVACHRASSKPVIATKSWGPMCSAGGFPLRVTKSVGALLLMLGASCGSMHTAGWVGGCNCCRGGTSNAG